MVVQPHADAAITEMTNIRHFIFPFISVSFDDLIGSASVDMVPRFWAKISPSVTL